LPLREPNQLYANRNGRFVDVSKDGGLPLERREVSRGVLAGDLDNDGDIDVVVTNNNGSAQVLPLSAVDGPSVPQ